MSTPYVRGVNNNIGTLDWSRTAGIWDMGFVTLLSPNLQKWILGLGPTFIFPTASTNRVWDSSSETCSMAIATPFSSEKTGS
jgi:hypothetical protein